MTVLDFQILIKSCSNESRNDPSPKSEVVHETKFSLKISYSTHVCLAELDEIVFTRVCLSVRGEWVSLVPSPFQGLGILGPRCLLQGYVQTECMSLGGYVESSGYPPPQI